MNKGILLILKVILFFVSISLIFIGHRSIGKIPLFIMLLGVSGLLILLYDYNRKFV